MWAEEADHDCGELPKGEKRYVDSLILGIYLSLCAFVININPYPRCRDYIFVPGIDSFKLKVSRNMDMKKAAIPFPKSTQDIYQQS